MMTIMYVVTTTKNHPNKLNAKSFTFHIKPESHIDILANQTDYSC